MFVYILHYDSYIFLSKSSRKYDDFDELTDDFTIEFSQPSEFASF